MLCIVPTASSCYSAGLLQVKNVIIKKIGTNFVFSSGKIYYIACIDLSVYLKHTVCLEDSPKSGVLSKGGVWSHA